LSDVYSLNGLFGNGDELSLKGLYQRVISAFQFIGEIFDALKRISLSFIESYPFTKEYLGDPKITKEFSITKPLTKEFSPGFFKFLSSFNAQKNYRKEFSEICNTILEYRASSPLVKEFSKTSSITKIHQSRNGILKEFSSSVPISKEVVITTTLW